MPDQDLLPRGHVLQAAPRPPAGLGDVLVRAGRRRRRRQAGVLATGAAACAAVLAFTMATSGTVDSLGVTPATRTGHDVLTTDTPQPSAPDGNAPAAVDGFVGSPSTGVAPGSGEQPTAADGTEQTATTAASGAAVQQTGSGSEVGPPHTMTAYDPTRGCSGTGSNVPEGWCGYYDGATRGPAGKRVELAETLCRLPNRGTGTLLSDDGQQAEFAVFRNAYTMWTWSTGHRFSKRGTSIAVPAGSCVRWHVSWNVVDQHGRPLPQGAYDVSPKPNVYPSQAAAPATVYADANFVTFTVTS